ncbi:MAG TPA: sterol desaturase family protein [Micropepsaceae bacterium]|nr:sterol desaturase family protein [Micropepsaceae bacterium]
MTMLASALDILRYQVLRFLNPSDGYYWAYLVGGLMFALAVMLWRRRGRRTIRARSLLPLLGSRALWFHRSTRLDLKLYLIHGVLSLTVYGLFHASSEAWRAGTISALDRLAGPAPQLYLPVWIGGIITTIVQIVALELGYWAMHYALHKVPALWEVHKVHHSAEVLTPLAEWRQHPIEIIITANVVALTNGGAYGAMEWLFGPSAHPLTLFQINALLVLHFATFLHLRHSSVWIAATGWLGRVFHSPAHHQIHHSSDPRHFNRNLGYALSIWDWAFGTLCIPEARGKVHFGVANEAPYRGLTDTLTRPLVAGAKRLRFMPRIAAIGMPELRSEATVKTAARAEH